MRRRCRVWSWTTRLALAAWLAVGLVGAKLLTRPFPGDIPAWRDLDGHPLTDVTITATDGARLSAWLIPRDPDRCAVLLAGVRGSRLAMVARARLYLELGWSVLLPDLRGTGASDARPISFGWNERHDVAAAIAFARARGYATVLAHGVSLGAAALLYALADGVTAEQVVLESPYDSIGNALARRLPWVPVPRLTLWPLAVCTGWEIGARHHDLEPARAIRSCTVPTLLLTGAADPYLGSSETRRMFEGCGAGDKRMHAFPGVGHEDLLNASPTDYRAQLRSFVGR